MVPVLVLAGIAFAIIKTLMSVVARDQSANHAPWSPGPASMPTYEPTSYEATSYDPTVRLRATVNDDARGFLLPASPEPADAERPDAERPAAEQPGAEQSDVTEPTRLQR